MTPLTVTQAAARVHRDPRTIKRWLTEGLPSKVVNGRRYIAEDDLLTHFRTKLEANPTRPRRAQPHV